MRTTIKDFAALAGLRAQLQQAGQERAEAAARQQQAQKLAQQEAQLFARSVGAVVPLAVPPRAASPTKPPAPVAHQRQADEQAALQESLSDEFTPETLLATDDELSYMRSGLGADVLRKLRRGDWVIQAQLDLHGLRRDAARDALIEFIRHSRKNGIRCVRVIHGKGLGSVNKEPVLKSRVRNWLAQKQEVLAFCQARPMDGGAGALIVLLQGANRE